MSGDSRRQYAVSLQVLTSAGGVAWGARARDGQVGSRKQRRTPECWRRSWRRCRRRCPLMSSSLVRTALRDARASVHRARAGPIASPGEPGPIASPGEPGCVAGEPDAGDGAGFPGLASPPRLLVPQGGSDDDDVEDDDVGAGGPARARRRGARDARGALAQASKLEVGGAAWTQSMGMDSVIRALGSGATAPALARRGAGAACSASGPMCATGLGPAALAPASPRTPLAALLMPGVPRLRPLVAVRAASATPPQRPVLAAAPRSVAFSAGGKYVAPRARARARDGAVAGL